MDVESTSDIGDWKDNAIVFKLETEKGTPRARQVQEYLMDKAGVATLFCQVMRKPIILKDYVVACLFDADAVKKCKEKIECQEKGTEIYEKVMNQFNPKTMCGRRFKDRWDDACNSRWVLMKNLNQNPTRKQIIDHIKKNGNIKVNKKDIYIGQSDTQSFARIECPSNSDALKLMQTLNISKLNGSKIFVVMLSPLEGMPRTVVLDNLDTEVTEQDIADHLQKCGKIETPPKYIRMYVDKKQNLKYAKIAFDSNKDVVQTVRNLNISKLKGREVFVRWSKPGLPGKIPVRAMKSKREGGKRLGWTGNVKKIKVERKSKSERTRKLIVKGQKGWTKPRYKIKRGQ